MNVFALAKLLVSIATFKVSLELVFSGGRLRLYHILLLLKGLPEIRCNDVAFH